MHVNIEIKAAANNHSEIRQILKQKNAEFIGTDPQKDTYFRVNNGRLKLREGNIENSLIHYNRENKQGPKQSDVLLYKSNPKSSLKEILVNSLGVWVVVDKLREIYFIENVKFHIDRVEGLGNFAEIEAIDKDGSLGVKKLTKQCNYYLELFGIPDEQLMSESYSDMLLKISKSEDFKTSKDF
ncbi:MAG: class IV adenylate cyclase [Bacteroidota bacterium]|nr:class IV adenylate cyclase [Bacteroidota bacterium]